MRMIPRCVSEAEVVGHVSVASSSIASVAYRPEDELLELRFRSGAVYQYLRVPQRVHGAFLAAASKGRYFNEAIRGRFEYQRGGL